MTSDQIQQWAREAGLQLDVIVERYPVLNAQLQRFATLAGADLEASRDEYQVAADKLAAENLELRGEVESLREQVRKEQEPVAWGVIGEGGYDPKDGHKQLIGLSIHKPVTFFGSTAMPLYAAPVAPQAVPAVCEWGLDDDESGTWASCCGELWSFIDGGPEDNRVRYCHHCGGRVKLAAPAVEGGV